MTANIVKYKGYTALIGYSEGDDEFFGNVVGIEPHGINFGGKSVAELKKHFKESVDEYLEVCKEQDIEPKKPCNGRISYRTTPQTHAKLLQAAMLSGKRSLNAFIDDILSSQANKILEQRKI